MGKQAQPDPSEWERLADRRDRVAWERDRLADERDLGADEREHALDERELAVTAREDALRERRIHQLEQSRDGLAVTEIVLASAQDRLDQSQAALDRAKAGLARRRAHATAGPGRDRRRGRLHSARPLRLSPPPTILIRCRIATRSRCPGARPVVVSGGMWSPSTRPIEKRLDDELDAGRYRRLLTEVEPSATAGRAPEQRLLGEHVKVGCPASSPDRGHAIRSTPTRQHVGLRRDAGSVLAGMA